MPLGFGIAEVLRAIPPRIEVSGHGPTTRITAGSFDAALAYAREVHGDVAVLAVGVRNRWWPRVTLTVTTDTELARTAPALADLRHEADELLAPPLVEAASEVSDDEPQPRDPVAAPTPASQGGPDQDDAAEPQGFFSTLDEIFEHQEQERQRRTSIPRQREGD